MNINKFANLIPDMNAVEYKELKNSIFTNGQHIPIVLHQGEILDGRHRYRACMELGIEPLFEDRDDVDPFQFTIAMITRRNLTASQRAMAVAEMYSVMGLLKRKAEDSYKENVGRPKQSFPISETISNQGEIPIPKTEPIHTHVEAAKLAHTSPSVMSDAIKVNKSGSESLKAAVKSGTVPVSQAAAIADLPHVMQQEAVQNNTVKELAKEAPVIKREIRQAEYITLEAWATMPTEEKKRALNAESDKSFNRQDGDSIEWAQWSWNPITGCLHGCAYCYARGIAVRFNRQGFAPSLYPDRLQAPYNTRQALRHDAAVNQRNVFVCSMSDFMGAWQPAEWINAVLSSMEASPQFNFLLLTKNPRRYLEFTFPSNCWLGATIDCQARVKDTLDVMQGLKRINKMKTWVSFEPLTEELEFDGKLTALDWVVIGGQTGFKQFYPSVDWWAKLHMNARQAGCAIYHKANLGLDPAARIKEFPC